MLIHNRQLTTKSNVPIGAQPIINNETNVPTGPPIWGELSIPDLKEVVDNIYNEIVFWRRNIFLLPTGACGTLLSCIKAPALISKYLKIWAFLF